MAGLGDLVQRATPSGRDAGYQPRQDKPIPDIASARRGRAMTDSEFQGLVFSWATDARNYSDEFLSTERYNSTLYYRGHLPDVDLDAAQEDRSSAVMTEVRDTILGIMPDLLRIFFSADGVVKFNPVPTADPQLYARRCQEADQATAYVQNVVLKVDNPDSFRTFYDAFQDAAVRKTGLIKWWWEKTQKPTYSSHTSLSEEQALALAADPEVEVLGKRAYLDPTFIPLESINPPPQFRKREVKFEDYASGEDHCGECRHFKPPGGCELVAGAISPQSWCDLYEQRQIEMGGAAIPGSQSPVLAGAAASAGPGGPAPADSRSPAAAAPLAPAAAARAGGGPAGLPVPAYPPPPMVYDLKIKRIKEQGRVRIRAVPCENVIVARRGVSVDRTSLFGMTEDKTVGDFLAEGLIDDPEELADCDMDSAHDGDNWETQARRPQIMSLQGPADNPAADPSMRIVKYGELYITADRDGDGIPELIRVITGGIQYKILHEEPVDDIPFADFCPYPEAHQFFGESIADLTRDIQRIKSRILRDMLDSLAQSVTPQVGVVEGQVNLDDVLNPDTSRVIRMRQPGMVQPINLPFVGKEAMPVLDLMTQVRENRTGQSDASAGLDPAVLQSSTRAAVQATLTKAQSRVEMVARIFAETGMRRLFRGILRETIKHMDEPRAVRLGGQESPVAVIDPRHWNAEMDVEPTLMLGRGSQQDQLQSLTDILTKQELILQTLGPDNPIVTLDQYSYTLRKLVELSGWRNAASFFNDMSQMDPQAKQQAIQQMTQQMAAKAGAGKSGPDPQIEQAKIASQEKIQQMKMQLEAQKDQAALQLEALKMKAQMQVQILQMQADHQQAMDQAMVDSHTSRFNTMVDAHVAHHGNIMSHAAKVHIAKMNGNGAVK